MVKLCKQDHGTKDKNLKIKKKKKKKNRKSVSNNFSNLFSRFDYWYCENIYLIIDEELIFNSNIRNICRKAGRKFGAQSRISTYLI